MKKEYEKPEFELLKVEEDIITTSVEGDTAEFPFSGL